MVLGNKAILIMLVGLPASGKSTAAIVYSDVYNAHICSSDNLRQELFGDINCQEKNKELFQILEDDIRKRLCNGENVIYDATNINRKRRMAFLRSLDSIDCQKNVVFFATQYEICLQNNQKRERKVPEEVIRRMYINFDIPHQNEGWDHVNYIEWYNECDFTSDIFKKYVDIEQDNSHHSCTLLKHLATTCAILFTDGIDNNVLLTAAYFHDCGKPFVKSRTNIHGELTDESHYYNHQNVSAYMSIFYMQTMCHSLERTEILDAATMIAWHMQPYFAKSDKAIARFKRNVGEKMFTDIMLLHKADKAAH